MTNTVTINGICYLIFNDINGAHCFLFRNNIIGGGRAHVMISITSLMA